MARQEQIQRQHHQPTEHLEETAVEYDLRLDQDLAVRRLRTLIGETALLAAHIDELVA